MSAKPIAREARKTIALVAHDNKKQDLLDWARFNKETLAGHRLLSKGTTGSLLERELGLRVQKLLSGPLGVAGEQWLVTGADGEAMPPGKNVGPGERLGRYNTLRRRRGCVT